MKLSFRLPLLACASAAALLAAPAANAHVTGVPHRQAKAAVVGEDSTSVPLFENLGSHSYPVTTANHGALNSASRKIPPVRRMSRSMSKSASIRRRLLNGGGSVNRSGASLINRFNEQV
jgi:hypothetical protein